TRVQNRYGMEGRRNLGENLFNHLRDADPEAFRALRDYMMLRYPSAAKGKGLFPLEEYFTMMLNYLNDPHERKSFHDYRERMGTADRKVALRHDQDMKRAFSVVQQAAAAADPNWVLKRSEQPLDKSLPGLLAGLTAAVPVSELAAWTPRALHNELVPIAHLESSWGQHMNHAPSPKGEYHTAVGALGIKPVTVHEEYLRSPSLQKLYPGLTGPVTFMQKLKADPQFYNIMGGAH